MKNCQKYFIVEQIKKENIKNEYNEVIIISDTPGSGTSIKNHYKITAHYIGTLEDGTEFDNTYKRNQPFVFQYGLRQVIQGWEIGLKGIQIGGKTCLRYQSRKILSNDSTGKGWQ